MALLELALVGGAIYSGIHHYRQRSQKQRSLVVHLQNVTDQPTEGWRDLLHQVDARYQTFVQTHLDPLLEGHARHQQMELLTTDTNRPLQVNEVLMTTDMALNRYLAASLGLMGTALLSAWLFPPLSIISVAGAIMLNWTVYVGAYHALRERKLVTSELITALYISGMWLAGYFVFGAFSCFLFYLGTKVLFRMEGRSRQGFAHLFGQQPHFAWRVVEGTEIQVPTTALEVGDIVVVNAGEAIPVDGIITQGMALIDQHHLTGESQPAEKGVGERVLAATLLLTGRIWISVEKAGDETTAAQISTILEQTANHQTKLVTEGQQLADRSALPNLLLSLAAFPLRGFVGSVAVLGAGFGFNLRTCSLLSMLNYLQIAAHNAILIKDGRALEQLAKVDTVVFDKTGTLTLEQPHVANIHCAQPTVDETTVLLYAAAAEFRQPHPIAKAILAAAEERGLALPMIDEAGYEVGFGIRVTIAEQVIRVGSARFLQQSNIAIPEAIQTVQAACRQQGHSLVMVARNDELIGALELHATPRPEVQQVVADLLQRNLHLTIISGDQEEPTHQLANHLGIKSYFANTLPENKASLITQLQQEGRVVCFIGDGINDAIALKQADVSISLRGATTIATDTAQIVLMDQSLTKLGTLFDLAQKFDRTITQGFWTTMIPGVICIGGVFFLHFGIIAAELLFQLGFFTGLGVSMYPLLQKRSIDNVRNDK
ncbi:MAG: heavy metal translocating P-type ATPase [Caldilineaceae bacterium]|nr:heavy metal translocating P-type ATPase [Caldilineaceae bacterium]